MYKVKLTTPQIFSEKKLKARYLAQLHRVSCFQKDALHKQSTVPTQKNQTSVNINATFLQTNPHLLLGEGRLFHYTIRKPKTTLWKEGNV